MDTNALSVADHQVRIDRFHVLGHQPKLRNPVFMC